MTGCLQKVKPNDRCLKPNSGPEFPDRSFGGEFRDRTQTGRRAQAGRIQRRLTSRIERTYSRSSIYRLTSRKCQKENLIRYPPPRFRLCLPSPMAICTDMQSCGRLRSRLATSSSRTRNAVWFHPTLLEGKLIEEVDRPENIEVRSERRRYYRLPWPAAKWRDRRQKSWRTFCVLHEPEKS